MSRLLMKCFEKKVGVSMMVGLGMDMAKLHCRMHCRTVSQSGEHSVIICCHLQNMFYVKQTLRKLSVVKQKYKKLTNTSVYFYREVRKSERG